MNQLSGVDWSLILLGFITLFAIIIFSLNTFLQYLDRRRLLSMRLTNLGVGNTAEGHEAKSTETLLFISRQHNLVERKIAQYLSLFQSEHQLQIFLYQCGLKISLTRMFLIWIAVVTISAMGLYKHIEIGYQLIGISIGATTVFLYLLLYIIRMQRRSSFDQLFSPALDILVRSVKSGHSLEKALRIVAHEIPAPVGKEFATILQQIEVGQNFDKAMREAALRVSSRGFTFLMDALIVQHETGGSLEDVLENIIFVQRRRRELEQKVKTATAEVRASIAILTSLPILLGILFLFAAPEYMRFFYTTPDGLSQTQTMLTLFALELIVIKFLTRIDMD